MSKAPWLQEEVGGSTAGGGGLTMGADSSAHLAAVTAMSKEDAQVLRERRRAARRQLKQAEGIARELSSSTPQITSEVRALSHQVEQQLGRRHGVVPEHR